MMNGVIFPMVLLLIIISLMIILVLFLHLLKWLSDYIDESVKIGKYNKEKHNIDYSFDRQPFKGDCR